MPHYAMAVDIGGTFTDVVLRDASGRTFVDKTLTTPKRRRVVSIAVSLLNAYLNPANERAIRDIIQRRAPELYVSISSDVAPQIREYPRTSTVAMNAYTAPITGPYLDALRDGLKQRGF